MTTRDFTLIDDGRTTVVPARVEGDSVWISPKAVQETLGWQVKPEGLCRGDVCLSVRSHADRVNEDGVDLIALAEILGRPLALDTEQRVAALAASAEERGYTLSSLEAPDFTLPDLSGVEHSLSDFRGKKVLLVAYASW